jgi:hypothetical protein
MVFFLAFLVLTTTILPTITLSQLGRLAVSLAFALTTILGAFATIRHRTVTFIVVAVTVGTFATDVIVEFNVSHGLAAVDTTMKVACLAILVFMTLRRTLRPGRVTRYRVVGGIAGYLLIGFAWAFGYQLLEQTIPDAIHFEGGAADNFSKQPNELIYFSFVTLTTVGYGDVQPVHPVARSLAVAEALVGQLYLAILISSLVGMALQARAETESGNEN